MTPPRTRLRRTPAVEGLEARELMSATPVAHPFGATPVPGGLTSAPSFQGNPTPKSNLGPLKADISLVPTFEAIAYPALRPGTDIPNPQPTPGEVAREYFTAELSGTYTVTPGHFAGQAATVKIATTTVHSNQFLHGKGQVIIETPTSSSAPFYGTAALFPENVLYSGETVVLDLEGNPTTNPRSAPTFDANGLPTHLVWVPDAASGTGYTGATGFGQGYGYMDAVYHPNKGSKTSGKVTVLFQGLFNTAGILSYDDPGTQ